MTDITIQGITLQDHRLAGFAKALGHPVRIQILRILAERSACVCGDIVAELPLAQSTVSQHLKVLKDAGLIRGTIDGPRVCYCVEDSALTALKTLVASLPDPTPPTCHHPEYHNQ